MGENELSTVQTLGVMVRSFLTSSSNTAAKWLTLGGENKLIFAPGLLSGTPMINTSRISMSAKSALTEAIKESIAFGTSAADLGLLGITAVMVEGKRSGAGPDSAALAGLKD